jgi:hypothetical protein
MRAKAQGHSFPANTRQTGIFRTLKMHDAQREACGSKVDTRYGIKIRAGGRSRTVGHPLSPTSFFTIPAVEVALAVI